MSESGNESLRQMKTMCPRCRRWRNSLLARSRWVSLSLLSFTLLSEVTCILHYWNSPSLSIMLWTYIDPGSRNDSIDSSHGPRVWNDPRPLVKHVPSLTYCVFVCFCHSMQRRSIGFIVLSVTVCKCFFYPQEAHDIESLRRFFIYKMFFFMTDLILISRPSRCLTVVSACM